MTDQRRRGYRWLLIGSVAAVGVGVAQKLWLADLPDSAPDALHRLYTFQQGGFKQLGVLGVGLALLGMGLERLGANRLPDAVIAVAPKLVLASLAFFGAGELIARVVFHGGMSFSNHGGPMVRRFERDFEFNCYREPQASRGPDACSARSAPGSSVRVLVQGDSITWGQGVQDEDDLYTSILRDKLRDTDPAAEVATLAVPGREIDGHLQALKQYGDEIRPDVIIYQWCENDMELDKSLIPTVTPPLRRLFFADFLARHSYFWFLLDYGISGALFDEAAYFGYLHRYYENDTPQWKRFERGFADWVEQARHSTDRILVFLYQSDATEGFRLEGIHQRMIALCEKYDVEVIDFREHGTRLDHDPNKIFATPFDRHPSVQTHAIAAEVLHRQILEHWPAVAGPRTASSRN